REHAQVVPLDVLVADVGEVDAAPEIVAGAPAAVQPAIGDVEVDRRQHRGPGRAALQERGRRPGPAGGEKVARGDERTISPHPTALPRDIAEGDVSRGKVPV